MNAASVSASSVIAVFKSAPNVNVGAVNPVISLRRAAIYVRMLYNSFSRLLANDSPSSTSDVLVVSSASVGFQDEKMSEKSVPCLIMMSINLLQFVNALLPYKYIIDDKLSDCRDVQFLKIL